MTNKIMPKLPLTVDLALWKQFALTITPEYADSYLSGADAHNGKFLPRTQTAWYALKDNGQALRLFAANGLKLLKPPPFRPTDDE